MKRYKKQFCNDCDNDCEQCRTYPLLTEDKKREVEERNSIDIDIDIDITETL